MPEGDNQWPHLADTNDIDRWSERMIARTEFPRLLRALIQQTNDQIANIHMPAGPTGESPGFDGQVRALSGTPLVPMGFSVWELGTGKNPRQKANDDYRERTKDSLGIDKARTTFVFVSSRHWPDKTDWAASKKTEGLWLDVKAFDAEDIVTALETDRARGLHFWFSAAIGLPSFGVMTIEQWWNKFSGRSSPTLVPELVIAGRYDQSSQLLTFLGEECRPITISSVDSDEILAFVAATQLSCPDDQKYDLLTKTLVVLNAVTLMQLEETAGCSILVPFNQDFEREALLVTSHHVIILVCDGSPVNIALPGVDEGEAAAILGSYGVPEQTALELGVAINRGVVHYMRAAPAQAGGCRPWAKYLRDMVVRRAWIAGSWSENRSGDRDAISSFIGLQYEAIRDNIETLAGGEDPLFEFVAGTWRIVCTGDVWEHGYQRLTSQDLNRAEKLAQDVLGAIDPSLDLPAGERWKAPILGKSRINSSDLRMGLASTLALFGDRARDKTVKGLEIKQWVDDVVFNLLSRANGDLTGNLWASVSDVLPLLAEAAPNMFLTSVEMGCSGQAPLLKKLFLDGEADLSINSPHTDLLWALETVAWSPEYLLLSSELLARLAEIDPGGRLSNRPAKSLEDIFSLLHPQTSTGLHRRLAVLEYLGTKHPTIAWSLLLNLLPTQGRVGSYTHKPTFRTWTSDNEKRVSGEQYKEALGWITNQLLFMADEFQERWCQLVPALTGLTDPLRQSVITRMAEVAGSFTKDDIDPTEFWNSIMIFVRHHRSYSETDWALQDKDLNRLEEIADTLIPEDAVARNAWLFIQPMPDVAGVSRGNYSEYSDHLHARRRDAIAEVFESGGISKLMELANTTDFPGMVGHDASEAVPQIDAEVLQHLDDENDRSVTFSISYLSNPITNRNRSWFSKELQGLDGRPIAQARLLLCIEDLGQAWDLMAKCKSPVENLYWKEFSPWTRGDPFPHINEAADKLAEFSRTAVALELLAAHLQQTAPPVSVDTVVHVLKSFVELSNIEGPAERINTYEIQQLLEFLRKNEIDFEKLAMLEWQLYPALGIDARSPALDSLLASKPEFFVHVLSLCFKAADAEEEKEAPEVSERVAVNAYELLNNWRVIPGSQAAYGTIDGLKLRAWVAETRENLAAVGRLTIGDYYIGKVLANSKEDEDGTWPTLVIREFIEELSSPDMDDGFRNTIFNKRGVVTRGLMDGGKQEYALADKYGTWAKMLAGSSPKTAAILTSVSKFYMAEGRREDEESERFRRGLPYD